ncbi:hypothetical protein HB364_19735 [Pseudoflavitalea sp. X16]|uniref:hypothetical protein n=1 Tax=Paraflavitalea devenefica TaxID=2716334 RepID=UPI00142264D0|nr:hypothetical protein [Paraflavitalea devenefica]NII27331.1 hypothetical protein [Paraflavitalea devenefica]
MINKIVIISMLFLTQKANAQSKNYFKFNSCELGMLKKNIPSLDNVAILDFKMANDRNSKKKYLAAYYLIKSTKDTFNVIQIFNQSSSDSTLNQNRDFKAWHFEQMKDTCIDFRSAFDLKKILNHKYPLLIGSIFLYEY